MTNSNLSKLRRKGPEALLQSAAVFSIMQRSSIKHTYKMPFSMFSLSMMLIYRKTIKYLQYLITANYVLIWHVNIFVCIPHKPFQHM